jgi:hypothetical protein
MAMQYTPFLRWLLIVVTTSIGWMFAGQFGLFREIHYKDASRICYVIFAILAFMSVWCGRLTKNLDSTSGDGLATIESSADVGWFMSDLCLSLGMLGTVIGFIMILVGGFDSMVAGDTASLAKMFTKLGAGLGTALYTTLIGLLCSMILKMQYFNLCNALDLKKVNCNNEA